MARQNFYVLCVGRAAPFANFAPPLLACTLRGGGGRRWRQERERKDNIQPKPQEGGEEDSNLVPWDGFETMKGIITEGRERERGKKKNHAKKMDGRGKLNRVSR